jgi:hypothetical protein
LWVEIAVPRAVSCAVGLFDTVGVGRTGKERGILTFALRVFHSFFRKVRVSGTCHLAIERSKRPRPGMLVPFVEANALSGWQWANVISGHGLLQQ